MVTQEKQVNVTTYNSRYIAIEEYILQQHSLVCQGNIYESRENCTKIPLLCSSNIKIDRNRMSMAISLWGSFTKHPTINSS
jgi:hypothetical protein